MTPFSTLSVSASAKVNSLTKIDPLKEADFKYTYELHDDFARNFLFYLAFPTMAAIINKFDLVSPFSSNPDFP